MPLQDNAVSSPDQIAVDLFKEVIINASAAAQAYAEAEYTKSLGYLNEALISMSELFKAFTLHGEFGFDADRLDLAQITQGFHDITYSDEGE